MPHTVGSYDFRRGNPRVKLVPTIILGDTLRSRPGAIEYSSQVFIGATFQASETWGSGYAIFSGSGWRADGTTRFGGTRGFYAEHLEVLA